ncbi:hypothetical protein ACLOJK_038609, partial [Asimina triloba]
LEHRLPFPHSLFPSHTEFSPAEMGEEMERSAAFDGTCLEPTTKPKPKEANMRSRARCWLPW